MSLVSVVFVLGKACMRPRGPKCVPVARGQPFAPLVCAMSSRPTLCRSRNGDSWCCSRPALCRFRINDFLCSLRLACLRRFVLSARSCVRSTRPACIRDCVRTAEASLCRPFVFSVCCAPTPMFYTTGRLLCQSVKYVCAVCNRWLTALAVVNVI